MLPSLSTTTLPWQGPMTDLPSEPRAQPGTVSKVMIPQPIRTGAGVSAARSGAVRQNARATALARERFITIVTPDCGFVVEPRTEARVALWPKPSPHATDRRHDREGRNVPGPGHRKDVPAPVECHCVF